MHLPYGHPDSLQFLTAIKKRYRPDYVVCIGDEVDSHAMSFHNHDPDLFGAQHELQEAKKKLAHIYKLFPKVSVVDSNHGSLVYRRAMASGMPRDTIKSYNEILGAPKGWVWKNDLILTATNDQQIYFCHSKGSDVLKTSQAMGMSMVVGHHHQQFEIRYWSNPNHLHFGMTVGCLIDDKSLAFSYNRVSVKRPIIGCGIVLGGYPRLLPMVLNKNGRWNKCLV